MALPEASPLTGIFQEETVIIDFGEHEGKSVLEVSDTHPAFYQRMIEAKEEKDCEFSIRRGFGKNFLLSMNVTVQETRA